VIQQYLSIVWRWLWLLLLTTMLSSTTAYIMLKDQPTLYEASARLLIGPGVDSVSPDLNDFRAATQLMKTYAELITSRPVFESVIADLNLSISADDLKQYIDVKTDETTQVLRITASGLNPIQTANIANALAKYLVRLSPLGSGNGETQFKTQINTQIDGVQQDIDKSEAIVKQLETKLQTTKDVEERRLVNEQIIAERTQLSEARRTLASLYTSFQTSYINKVQVVELAVSAAPINSGVRLTILMAAITGLFLALSIVLLFEYFDDTIKSADEFARLSNTRSLGIIAKHKPLRGHGRERFVVQALPNSKAAEAYRILGSKLLLLRYQANHKDLGLAAESTSTPGATIRTMTVEAPQIHSVLISSAQQGDDASEIAANLAVVLAQTGHRVILVDAYLHDPKIGDLFGITDPMGLSGLLTTQSPTLKLTSIGWAPNLSVLPGGPLPANPFELLVSARMAALIKELESQAEIVIVAASPLLAFADSLILASHVDGVVMVARHGSARRDTIKEIVESLGSLGAQIAGGIYDYNVGAVSARNLRKAISARSANLQSGAKVSTPLPSVKA
jgi:capsular exopolysaccharide synthesis family protein